MADLTLHTVSKHFGQIKAVDGLSFKMMHGELVVLLGPTGAGKTTTLRLIAGLETLDGGQIFIGPHDVTRAPIASRDVAFVFQQYSLYPHYSVFDNLAFPLRSPRLKKMWPKARVKARVEEIASLLHIDHKLQNRATQLSGGEMQRVAIGRALVRDPQLFLMDEPLSSLDAKLREELRIELKRIQLSREATILYVTHDQVEALTLADRIGVLAEGKLVQLGTPQEVYAQPNSLYVAQRLGSPKMNVLKPGQLGDNPPSGAAHVGVRPEDLTLRTGTDAQVVNLESLGAELVVQLKLADQTLHVLTDVSSDVRVGDEVALSADPARMVYFQADGTRIVSL